MRGVFIVLWGISVICLFFVSHHIKESLITSYLGDQVEVLEKEYASTVDHFKYTADMIYDRYAKRSEVVDLMWVAMSADSHLKDNIRESIYTFLKKPYEEFSHIGVKQFHFHFPNAISFLRMNRPDRYGDDLSNLRYSLVKTNKTKEKTVGFEEGRVLNGFRYVYPLYFRDLFVGTVGISISSMELSNTLNSFFEGHHLFFLNKEVVENKAFEDERSQYKPSFLNRFINELPSKEIRNDNTALGTVLIDQIDSDIQKRANALEINAKGFSLYSKIDGKMYLASFYPIKNIKGMSIAYVAKYNEDYRILEILLNYKISLFVGFLLCTLAWGFFYMIVRYWKQRNMIRTLLFDQVSESDEKLKIQEKMIVQQSKMATIGEMLGAIAHQWKQPLNRLGLIVQSIEYEIPEDCQKDWDMKKYIDSGMNEVQFMGETVNDFMRFIRPSEGQAICIIRNQIDDVVALVKSSVEKYNIQLNFEINDSEDDQITAMCHGNDFNHILMNLIINARDAILNEKERHPSDDLKGVITVTLTNKLDCVWISVSDNGGGVPPEVEANIFEAHFTTKQKKEGSGLGLYVIKKIIEEGANGSIAVINNRHGGATFTITLPK